MGLEPIEYDAKELEVAAEESMLGNNSCMLDQILEALNKLGAKHGPHSEAPTKQGGVNIIMQSHTAYLLFFSTYRAFHQASLRQFV